MTIAYVAIGRAAKQTDRDKLLKKIKDNMTTYGISNELKFMEKTFGLTVTTTSSDGGSIELIYLTVTNRYEMTSLKDHHENRLYALKIRKILMNGGFKAEICETCDKCGKSVFETFQITIKRCGKCQRRYYCSRECQKKDWMVHKLSCK